MDQASSLKGSSCTLETSAGCGAVVTDLSADQIARQASRDEMLAEPFESFTFSATGASVYQLGSFGTARLELKALPLTP